MQDDSRKVFESFFGTKLSDEEIGKKVDERSESLMQELRSHYEQVKSEVPDWRIAYEGWTIQKIAGLQLAVDELTKHLKNVNSQLELLQRRRR